MEDLSDCLLHHRQNVIFTNTGPTTATINYTATIHNPPTSINGQYTNCWLYIRTPFRRMTLSVFWTKQTCTMTNFVHVYTYSYEYEMTYFNYGYWRNIQWTGCDLAEDPISPIFSNNAYEIYVGVFVKNLTATPYHVSLGIRLVPISISNTETDLCIYHVSSFSGYVQPRGYNPESDFSILLGFSNWVIFIVPKDHVIMLSVPQMEFPECKSGVYFRLEEELQEKIQSGNLENSSCHRQLQTISTDTSINYVTVNRSTQTISLSDESTREKFKVLNSDDGISGKSKRSCGHTRAVFNVCGYIVPAPIVSNNNLLLHVATDSLSLRGKRPLRNGFRLMFTFHKKNEKPTKLDSGRWNCTGSAWSKFKPHLWCNLVVECEGGEDEASCQHSTCQKDGILLSGSCYIVRRPEPDLTYSEARKRCKALGARLASFKSDQEMKDVIRAIWYRKKAFPLYVGARSAYAAMPYMYKSELIMEDSTMGFHLSRLMVHKLKHPFCGMMIPFVHEYIHVDTCELKREAGYLCKYDRPPLPRKIANSINITNLSVRNESFHTKQVFITCPKGHLTHTFLACDEKSDCWLQQRGGDNWEGESGILCDAPIQPLPPSFSCGENDQRVPYTLVCDHRPDCWDGSDEKFCVFSTNGQSAFACSGNKTARCGRTQECFPASGWCDGKQDCVKGEDEAVCEGVMSKCLHLYRNVHAFRIVYRLPPPHIIVYIGHGDFAVLHMNRRINSLNQIFCGMETFGYSLEDDFWQPERVLLDFYECPASHFQCPGRGYCLPVFLRCNDVNDCLGKEDEKGCEDYVCPGYYRCRDSKVCLHPVDLCNDIFQCPQRDDELLCTMTCPEQCTCHGLSFICQKYFEAASFLKIRFLDAGGSGMKPSDLRHNQMLIHLGLSRCSLSEIGTLHFPNLISLDLSDNLISHITTQQLYKSSHLAHLDLSRNPLTSLFMSKTSVSPSIDSLKHLDLSGVMIRVFNTTVISSFPKLEKLNMSSSETEHVIGSGFQLGSMIRILDLRGCPVHVFPREMFKGLNRLLTVYADNYKFCCSENLPSGFNNKDCHGPTHIISSCNSLLGSSLYKAAFAIFTLSILLCDMIGIVGRFTVGRDRQQSSVGLMIVHQACCDVLMGLHLAIVTLTDQVYRGTYLWEDTSWRRSVTCQVSGVLFILSTNVSAFLTCLLTIDRCLVLQSRHRSLHFSTVSTQVTCAGIWVGGLVLATIPLIPGTGYQDVYSMTGVCQPLVALWRDSPNHSYTLAFVVSVTLALGSLTLVGQMYIFTVVRQRSNLVWLLKTGQIQSPELILARRVSTIVLCDVLCTYWVCLCVILIATDGPMSRRVWVGTSVTVLPLKSVLHPFLYLFGYVREQQRQKQRKRLLKRLGAKK